MGKKIVLRRNDSPGIRTLAHANYSAPPLIKYSTVQGQWTGKRVNGTGVALQSPKDTLRLLGGLRALQDGHAPARVVEDDLAGE